MSAFNIGRIVTKIMGREAGRKAVVTQLLDKNFVEISGPYEISGIKRRRVNIDHIEPTSYSLELNLDNNSDEAISELLNSNAEIKKLLEESL